MGFLFKAKPWGLVLALLTSSSATSPNHASKGSPAYCSAKDACACSEACK